MVHKYIMTHHITTFAKFGIFSTSFITGVFLNVALDKNNKVLDVIAAWIMIPSAFATITVISTLKNPIINRFGCIGFLSGYIITNILSK